MATKGLILSAFGKYAYTNNAVTYSEGKIIGHAISFQFTPTSTDDNPLYGDDMVVEHDNGGLNGGDLTLNISELPMADKAWLFGISTSSTSGGGIIYSYNDDMQPITVGYGTVEVMQINDVNKYLGTIFTKCIPKIPSVTANTKGASIEWQTPEIEFTVERDESSKHDWQKQQEFTTLSDAETWIKGVLGVSEG